MSSTPVRCSTMRKSAWIDVAQCDREIRPKRTRNAIAKHSQARQIGDRWLGCIFAQQHERRRTQRRGGYCPHQAKGEEYQRAAAPTNGKARNAMQERAVAIATQEPRRPKSRSHIPSSTT